MKSIIFLGFLFISFNCELTRHSDDVLKRERIFIEAHRGSTEGQKNHNTKEAILNAIYEGMETFETDVQLTKDGKLVLIHDFTFQIYDCPLLHWPLPLPMIIKINSYTWDDLQKCKTIEGGYKIPLLEDIMNITKGKIFMNLEIKEDNEEIWDKIQDLIEEYKYYDQISICGFNHNYYEKVEKYNRDFGRNIVFGFLYDDIQSNIDKVLDGINIPNHQISLNARFIKNNEEIIQKAHENKMTVAVWFFLAEPFDYYYYFEIGVDVIITNYPRKVKSCIRTSFPSLVS